MSGCLVFPFSVSLSALQFHPVPLVLICCVTNTMEMFPFCTPVSMATQSRAEADLGGLYRQPQQFTEALGAKQQEEMGRGSQPFRNVQGWWTGRLCRDLTFFQPRPLAKCTLGGKLTGIHQLFIFYFLFLMICLK